MSAYPIFDHWIAEQHELRSEWRAHAPRMDEQQALERFLPICEIATSLSYEELRFAVLDAGFWVSELAPDDCEVHLDIRPVFLNHAGEVQRLRSQVLLLMASPESGQPTAA